MTPFGEIPHAALAECKVPRFFEKFQGDASRHAFEARSWDLGSCRRLRYCNYCTSLYWNHLKNLWKLLICDKNSACENMTVLAPWEIIRAHLLSERQPLVPHVRKVWHISRSTWSSELEASSWVKFDQPRDFSQIFGHQAGHFVKGVMMYVLCMGITYILSDMWGRHRKTCQMSDRKKALEPRFDCSNANSSSPWCWWSIPKRLCKIHSDSIDHIQFGVENYGI